MIGRRSSVSTSFMLAALRVLHVDTSNAPARRASIEECPSTPWVSRDSSSRVSLYNPRTSRKSRKKKTEYISDAAQRQRIGQIEDVQQSAEYHDVLQQEADLTAGHGILRVTGLINVTASDADELESVVAGIEQAAIQASCETRRLWGQQAQAFTAAALPLCRTV